MFVVWGLGGEKRCFEGEGGGGGWGGGGGGGGETDKISLYTELVTIFHTKKFQSPLFDFVLQCHHHHKRSVNAGQ